MMCWTSLQLRHGRTCNMRATIPAARGAAADVPVWPSVQPFPRCMDQSEVTCDSRQTFRWAVQNVNVVKSSEHKQVSHQGDWKQTSQAKLNQDLTKAQTTTYHHLPVTWSHHAKATRLSRFQKCRWARFGKLQRAAALRERIAVKKKRKAHTEHTQEF